MTTDTLLYIIGSSGLFASRAFLPAFLTSLIIRFHDQLPYLASLRIAVSPSTSWFTHDVTIIILGLLAVLESLADKNNDIKFFLNEIHIYLKGFSYIVTNFSILDPESAAIIQQLQRSGFDFAHIVIILSLSILVGISVLKKKLIDFLLELDEDNSTGIHTLISWIEDFFNIIGIYILIIAPTLIIILTVLSLVILYVIQKSIEKRSEKKKVPCPNCNNPNHPSAPSCASCKMQFTNIKDINILGFALNNSITNLDEHKHKLLSVKRCPSCANLLKERKIKQTCSFCNTSIFSSEAEMRQYVQYIQKRLGKTLLLSAMFSVTFLFGVVIAIVYSRLSLVSPFRRYLSRWKTFSTRLVGKIIIFIMIVFHFLLVPTILIPLIYFGLWKNAFLMEYKIESEKQSSP